VGDVADGTNIDTSTLGAHTFTVNAADNAGNAATPVTHNYTVVDVSAPSISLTTPPVGAVYTLGQVVAADFSCADEAGGSGIASCVGTVADGAALNTGTVGSHSFTVNAADNAGNTNSVARSYTVIYPFAGFFAPIDNPVTGKMNGVKAGSSVPIKFSLGGNRGLNILAPGSPSSKQLACVGGTDLSTDTPTSTAGSSSLSYSSSTGVYTYVWKTEKNWSGQCRRLTVTLNDGTTHPVDFKAMK
jgi:hypothetical protein